MASGGGATELYVIPLSGQYVSEIDKFGSSKRRGSGAGILQRIDIDLAMRPQ
jgi:hypothetical protein